MTEDLLSNADATPEDKHLQGIVQRILFSNPDTGYSVIAVREGLGPKAREVLMVGSLPGVNVQETIKASGAWKSDKKYGLQFAVNTFSVEPPQSVAALEKYLASGFIRGVGPKTAKHMVERFGEGLIDILENEPARLREISKIQPHRIALITQGWNEHRTIRDITLFLQRYEIPAFLANRVFKHYGSGALDEIKKNPYLLATEVKGIGFKSADLIGQKLGVPLESIERCKAGVFYVLQDAAGSEGHCYLIADKLIVSASELLAVGAPLITSAIRSMAESGHLLLEELPDGSRAVYLKHLHGYETSVARSVQRLMAGEKRFKVNDVKIRIARFEESYKFELAPKQREAVESALTAGITIITGGPGTGKTTIVRAIIKIVIEMGAGVLLCAPTGRAAKRMQEVTGITASTIHRLLQYSAQEGSFLRNPKKPLEADIIIIDETSMVDMQLAHVLLRAVSAYTRVILVGDTDQLPSVGPGDFLAELIRSEAVPVSRLDAIYRQASGSGIVINAHRINQGQLPQSSKVTDASEVTDFVVVPAESPEQVREAIGKWLNTELAQRLNVDIRRDVQMLSPMLKGELGTGSLNEFGQLMLNGKSGGIRRGSTEFRVGDKVIQTVNDYDKDVFNGDIGFITDIDTEAHTVRATFDERIVPYDFNELDALELAWCITIHKSQGSEYPVVILPLHTQHAIMLRRNLLYTAVTRGKSLVVLIGPVRAIQMAVTQSRVVVRNTGLADRLRLLMERRT